MANANINSIQVTNTFDEWRVATNDLIQDRNILRNKVYVKDESDFQLANGALTLSRSTGGVLLTVTGSGGALVGGTTTTSDLVVQDDASVSNTLSVTGNTTVNSNVTVGMNVNVGMELSVSGNVAVNTDRFTIDSVTGDVTLTGDLSLDGGDLVSSANANVVNTSSNTVNFGGASETLRIGSTTGEVLLRNRMNVSGPANLSAGLNVAGDIETGGTINIGGEAFFQANTNASGNLHVTGGIYVNGNSFFDNVTVANSITISNASVTGTLTLTNPIEGPADVAANSIVLRSGSSVDGEGFFRVQRSVASGNVDIWWDETENTWKFMEDYPNSLNERANLSATLKSVRDFVVNTTATATQTLDLATSNWFRLTVNQNTTFLFANAPSDGVGMTASVLVNQDVSGNHTITWANNVYYENGIIPTPSANANTEDLWTFTTYDGGTSFLGKLAIKDSHLKTFPNTIEYLVVAGGGGGGIAMTRPEGTAGVGGGGAGGVRVGTGLSVTNTTYTITVGAGGSAGYQTNTAYLPTTTGNLQFLYSGTGFEVFAARNGGSGANSSITGTSPGSFSNVVATGGGFGGTVFDNSRLSDGGFIPGDLGASGIRGAAGGSGGGGGHVSCGHWAYGVADTSIRANGQAGYLITSLPAANGQLYVHGLQYGPSPGVIFPVTPSPGVPIPVIGNHLYDPNIPFNANSWITFGGNLIFTSDNTTPSNAIGYVHGYDPSTNKFFNYADRANGGPGNVANTSPSEGFPGGNTGYMIYANAHSARVNNDIGFMGWFASVAPAAAYYSALPRGLVFAANGQYTLEGAKCRYLNAFLLGSAGGGGGGGSAEAGFNGANVEIAPPYSGWIPLMGFNPVFGNNPNRGVPPTIISGSQVGGNGGNGIISTITGSSVQYGGGGGGYGANTGGTGGLGGGGTGGSGLFATYAYMAADGLPWTGNNIVSANSGTINTGGGGGGGMLTSGGGGSGIVVIRYPIRSLNGKIEYQPATGTTGTVSVANTGGYRVYTFTGSGTITF